MIKFNEIKYERINYDKTIMLVNNLLEQLVNCNDFSEYLELVKRINNTTFLTIFFTLRLNLYQE